MIQIKLNDGDAALIELCLEDRAAELERDAEKFENADSYRAGRAFRDSALTYRRLAKAIADAPDAEDGDR